MSSRAIKKAWALAAVLTWAAALIAVHGENPGAGEAVALLMILPMTLLAFPASLFVWEILHFVTPFIPFMEGLSSVSVTAWWLCFFAAGYAQWFALLPWARRKLGRK